MCVCVCVCMCMCVCVHIDIQNKDRKTKKTIRKRNITFKITTINFIKWYIM